MDFDEAIAAHTAWKHKLAAYLAKRDGSLEPADIASDDQCPLGDWIRGEGKAHAILPEYARLKKEHTRFHHAAAEIVRRANSGQAVSGEIILGARSDFTKASSGIIQALVGMKKKLAVQ